MCTTAGSEPAGTSRDRKVAKRRLATPIPARAYVAGAAFGLEGAGVVRGGELRAETEAKSQKERIQDNLAAGTSIVEAAAAAGADLAVLPELFPYCGLSLASMAEDARSASSEVRASERANGLGPGLGPGLGGVEGSQSPRSHRLLCDAPLSERSRRRALADRDSVDCCGL